MTYFNDFVHQVLLDENEKISLGFFTPYDTSKDFFLGLCAPFALPILFAAFSLNHLMYSFFILLSALEDAPTHWERSKFQFHDAANHFMSFLSFLVVTVITPCVTLAMLLTQSATSLLNFSEEDESALESGYTSGQSL